MRYNLHSLHHHHHQAKVAKLADAPDLGSGGAIRGGSSPPFRTNSKKHPGSRSMSQPSQPSGQDQPKLNLTTTPDYRDGYSNSVQVRMSVWDFFLVFGTMQQEAPDELTVKNFQGI